MSEYLFGCGAGWLPKTIANRAAKLGATLVNYQDMQCVCGYGHAPGTCPRARRHWFAAENLGEPHNGKIASKIAAITTLS